MKNNKILTDEMIDAAAKLGTLVKEDRRNIALMHAMEDYEKCEELNNLIAEYNTQQNLIVSADEEARQAISARIDELYGEVTEHPIYTAYTGAKENMDGLMNEIYAELQFAITGTRPCSHDCSSCGGSCHH